MILRECDCGLLATTEEELELFEKSKGSKHGRRNRCKACAADKTRGGESLKAKSVSCSKCKKVHSNPVDIYKMFRQVPPTGDLIVGGRSRVCKKCELKALIESSNYLELDGRLIPKDINKLKRESRITSKPLETVLASKELLERIQYEIGII